jgi:hypothetical protein
MLVQFDRPSESLRQRTLGPWPEDGAVRSDKASASPTSLVAETETKVDLAGSWEPTAPAGKGSPVRRLQQ